LISTALMKKPLQPSVPRPGCRLRKYYYILSSRDCSDHS
jgi:hypothetical protein